MTREALFMSLIPRAVWPANRALFRNRVRLKPNAMAAAGALGIGVWFM